MGAPNDELTHDHVMRRMYSDAAGTPGMHHFVWDGRDEHGTTAASGVYLVHSNDGHRVSQSHRVFLVK